MLLQCNNTVEKLKLTESALSGVDDLTLHGVLLFLSLAGTCLAAVLTQIQVFMQINRYSIPHQQKHIVRILLMVPIYSVANLMAVDLYVHAVYWHLLGNSYAAIGLASFFQLLTAYRGHDIHSQKKSFQSVEPKPWGWPISWCPKRWKSERGLLRTPADGVTLYNITFAGVFQYCLVLILNSVAGVIVQYFDRYCQGSTSPVFGWIWITFFNVLSALVSSFCLGQLHDQIKADVKEHKTRLKYFCMSIVLYLSTYQTLFISIITNSIGGATNTVQTPDRRIGIPSTILCLEMALVSALHLWAYPYKPYVIVADHTGTATQDKRYHGGPLGLYATLDALNPWDIFKAVGRSLRFIFIRNKHPRDKTRYTTISSPDLHNPGSTIKEEESEQAIPLTQMPQPIPV